MIVHVSSAGMEADMRTMILALMMVSPPVMATEQQFDLICLYGKTEVRYRIDLARGEACENTCDRVWKMGVVTAGEIRLKDTPRLYPDEIPQTITINRITGRLDHWIGGRGSSVAEDAQCQPAAFSGFPAARF